MPTRDLTHIRDVLPGVLDEAKQAQEGLAYEHAKPRALEAVRKAREASYQVRSPQAPVRLVKRQRFPAGHLAHTRTDVECPQCHDDCAHYRNTARTLIDCAMCDRASELHEPKLWMVIGPAYSRRTGGSR